MRDNGFTLIELLIALCVGMIILAAVYVAVNTSQKTSAAIERKVLAQQDARSALEIMAMEIRMASYNKGLNNAIWRNPGDCSTPSPNPTYKGIQAATANSITIEMDINDNGVIDNTANNPNEVITYSYNAANQYLTRATNCGAAQPFLGDLPANPRTLRVVNDLNYSGGYTAGDIPVFRYFNSANVEIPAGAADLGAAIPSIRTIEITLAVDTEDIDPITHVRRRMIYSTRVIPRNHGLNPKP